MVKKILFSVIVTLTCSLQADWCNPEIFACMATHAREYTAMIPYIDEITVIPAVYVGVDDKVHNRYNYLGSYRARAALENYQHARNDLMNTYMSSAVGDGIILGIMIVLLNRGIRIDLKAPEVCMLAGALALALAAQQRSVIGNITYFDSYLSSCSYEGLMPLIGHSLLSIAGTIAGAVFAEYLLLRAKLYSH